ncbi:hypothetical protein PAPYR_9629 [Paratrimastix pyriformis]|uniref:Uncharacterized protein n=1 Tax=Paratrimastix pyriformis TaxID=342808 RepID=A0ABQ8U9I1_9EUKA|nr:hypothetical protein PAPYR_11630 [Paratrimastix pyriformis]KAJ4455408.1 hypothetical protein PAPYR_9629 [Paratrimastix pyriformis]
MSKTEEQSGMTMEQMEEAVKIEEKKREAEAAVAQSEAASKKRREGKEASGLVLAELSKLDIGNGEGWIR